MMRAAQLLVAILGLICPSMQAQTALSNAVVVGSDYQFPTSINVTPGQILTLSVAGVSGVKEAVRAQQFPLPATLAGISVSAFLNSGDSRPAAMLAVQPLLPSVCGTQVINCGSNLTAITIQVPAELPATPPGLGPDVAGYFQVSAGGQSIRSLPFAAREDQIHIIRANDLLLSGKSLPFPNALVAHSDGTPVGYRSPAHGGETLTLYAVGLGVGTPVDPAIRTGVALRSPLALAAPVISFDFHRNAAKSAPSRKEGFRASYAGLVAGYAGLYQINVIIPAVPPDLPACTQDGQIFPVDAVASNLSVNVLGATSFDGASICVIP